jgi:AAA domain
MLKKELILKNPLRLLGDNIENTLPEGGFGAVLARAGVGKTSLAVQLALDSLLQNKNVLHISLSDPVSKVTLWYEEVFRNVSSQYESVEIGRLWETVLTHRFIMTFQVEGFSVPKLEERLGDLTEQGIFFPQMILIDGLPFDETVGEILDDLKTLARKIGVHMWFTVKTHRHEEQSDSGLPPQLENVSDLFEVAISLQPEGKNIHVNLLKGNGEGSTGMQLNLDPATMLIQDNA